MINEKVSVSENFGPGFFLGKFGLGKNSRIQSKFWFCHSVSYSDDFSIFCKKNALVGSPKTKHFAKSEFWSFTFASIFVKLILHLYICKAGMQTTSYKLQRLLVLVGLLIIGLPKSQD